MPTDPDVLGMSTALFERVQAVRAAGQVTTVYGAACSICGPFDTAQHGVAIHAVSNPGHVVTVTSTTTTVYQDRGKPFNAAEHRTDHER